MARRLTVLIMFLCATPSAFAQGVKDPSSPNAGVINSSNPPTQPSRPTATRNIPPASVGSSLGVRRAYRTGNRVRGGLGR